MVTYTVLVSDVFNVITIITTTIIIFIIIRIMQNFYDSPPNDIGIGYTFL